jgi:sensor histidine kinase YesM
MINEASMNVGKKKRRFPSLRRKWELILSLVLECIVVLSIAALSTATIYRQKRDDCYDRFYSISDRVTSDVRDETTRLNVASKGYFLSEEFQNLAAGIYTETSQESVEKINTLFNFMLSANAEVLKGVGFLPRNSEGALDASNMIFEGSDYSDVSRNLKDILPAADLEKNQDGHLFYLLMKFLDGSELSDFIFLGRNVLGMTESNHGQQLGLGFLYVSKSALAQPLQYATALQGLRLFVTSDGQTLLSSFRTETDATAFQGSHFATRKGSLNFIGWQLEGYFDTNEIFVSMSTFIISEAVILSLTLLAIIISYLLLHAKNMRSLNYLFDSFTPREEKETLTPINTTGDGEVDKVIVAYNGMLKATNDLNEQLADEKNKYLTLELNRSQAELKALYSQINRHFLINTLSSIRSLLTLNEIAKAKECLENLSDFLRYSLDMTSSSTLQNEVEATENYLKIQQIRYPNIEYAIHLEPGLENVEVPKVIIEPLVENAYVHGLQSKRGTIDISASSLGDSIRIAVHDNGIGVDAATAQAIQDKVKRGLPASDSQSYHGIALVNIKRRLEILYGPTSDLLFESQLNQGSTATIVFKKRSLKTNA